MATFFVENLPIVKMASKLTNDNLLAAYAAMLHGDQNPHAWYHERHCITNEQWQEALESEIAFRHLILPE